MIHVIAKAEQKLKHITAGEIFAIANLFNGNGYKLYVVGGAVRDSVAGNAFKDIDLATDAVPDEILRIITANTDVLPGASVNLQGKAFGVVALYTTENTDGYEIATFRQDLTVGRKPEVRVGVTIEEDVMRRDITMNAMFYDVFTGKIIDLVGGIDDMQENIVKMVGNPCDRIAEDPLRIMRVVRFAARYGYAIDADTVTAIKAATLDGVSDERIVDEITAGLKQAKTPWAYIKTLFDLGVANKIFPKASLHHLKKEIDSRNPTVILACILQYDDVVADITNRKWPTDVIKDVKYLHKLASYREGSECVLQASDILNVYKYGKIRNIDDADLVRYILSMGFTMRTQAIVYSAVEFTPFWTGDKLMSEGYSGKSLGEEMLKRESKRFQEKIGDGITIDN